MVAIVKAGTAGQIDAGGGNDERLSALGILRLRYLHGEINRDEYDRKRKGLIG